MHRSWKCTLVCRLAMMAFSPAAQADDSVAFQQASQAQATVTYTPTVREAIVPQPPVLLASPSPSFQGFEPIGQANHRLMGNAGFCSAVGEMGATYTYSPVQSLQLELGAGLGFSGLQLSLMPKVSVGSDRHRLVVGVGPSVGIDPDNNPPHTYVAYWLNAEMGYEYRSVGGFSFLIAGGFFRGIGGEYRGQCLFDCEGDTKGWPEPVTKIPTLPQMRVAFGRWF